MKIAHHYILIVPIKRLHFGFEERFDAREGFRASRRRIGVNDIFVEALEQAPTSALAYRLFNLFQDALQVITREIGLTKIIFLRPLADQLTCDIRKEQ